MKIRNGFVSNSSSSSFCIYGTRITEKDIKKSYPDKTEEDDFDVYEFLEDLFKDTELTSEYDEEGQIYIGREFHTIKDDETGKQFKNNIKETIERLLPKSKLKFETINETVVC